MTAWFFLFAKFTRPVIARRSYPAGNITAETAERAMKMGNTKITPQLIGQNIRRIRLEHGETQQELGQLIGYGATTVANYESGYRMPDLETFLAIAIHYGASIEDFVKEQVHES